VWGGHSCPPLLISASVHHSSVDHPTDEPPQTRVGTAALGCPASRCIWPQFLRVVMNERVLRRDKREATIRLPNFFYKTNFP